MTPLNADRRTKRIIFAAFAAIAGLLLLSQILAYFQSRSVQETVDLVEHNALASVRLINRMALDVYRQRVLIDRHVFEHEPARLAEVEAQIGAVKNDFMAASDEYGPLATLQRVASGWTTLRQDFAAVERQTAAALELSRANRDVEATRLLVAAEPTFDAVARDVNNLVEINQSAASQATERASEMQSTVLDVRLGLAATVLFITLLVGLRLSGVISRSESKLRQQAAVLEAKNRELDAFAGRVAHDLRGPLNTISLAASMLAERVQDDTATTEIMRRGIAQMKNLVEDLLGLSRAGAMTGAVARTEPVAASVAADLRPMATDAGGTLRVEVEPADVPCSEGLLRQVLWNLGENALKYRRLDAPPAVAIVGRHSADGYELRVSDNGVGMSPDDVQRTFEPFFRGERTKHIAGNGLGLAIVRRIVEASGGIVSVESQPGRGTTFVVRFPHAEAPDRLPATTGKPSKPA